MARPRKKRTGESSAVATAGVPAKKPAKVKPQSTNMFAPELLALVNKIRPKYGENSIVSGGELVNVQFRKMPTGVFELDTKIGGGLPRGRFTLIHGEESSTKTSLSVKVCAGAQKRCRFCDTRIKYTVELVEKRGEIEPIIHVQKPCKCGKNKPGVVVYLDAEGTLNLDYARKLGMNPDIAYIIQPDYAEQGIDVADAMIRSGEVDVVVVDSIATLTPTVEITESIEKSQMGVAARLVNKALRKWLSGLNSLGPKCETKPAIILINQQREKLGVMFGETLALPAGKGQVFYAALRLELTGGKVIRVDESGRELETKGEIVGRNIRWRVRKNKINGRHSESGEFKYYTKNVPRFGLKVGGVNNEDQIVGFARTLGLVEMGGGGNYSYGDVKGRGQPDFIANLKSAKQWNTLKKEVQTQLIQQRAEVEAVEDMDE